MTSRAIPTAFDAYLAEQVEVYMREDDPDFDVPDPPDFDGWEEVDCGDFWDCTNVGMGYRP